MGQIPQEVLQGELNLLWQHVFTWGSWAIASIMLLIALRIGIQQKTPFYVLACLAVGTGAFVEPLYDVAFDLWFFDVHDGKSGAMFSHFTAFGIIQPYWSHSGYIILYAAACLYAGRAMLEGRMTPRVLLLIWLAEIGASCLFEAIGTSVGVYTYYGPYVLRLWNYPFVIGVLEGTQTILFTIIAVTWWRYARTSLELAGLFVIFPIVMLGTNFGLGWPIIIALHLSEPWFSETAIWVGTIMSISFCALAVSGAYRFLPKTSIGRTNSS